MYGLKTWTIKTEETHFEHLRKHNERNVQSNPKNNAWKIRQNYEIEELIGGEDIVNFVKAQKLRWMEQSSM